MQGELFFLAFIVKKNMPSLHEQVAPNETITAYTNVNTSTHRTLLMSAWSYPVLVYWLEM